MSPKKILKAYWGYEDFRPMQEEIIHSILAGQDTLALLPTGGGKSICFQVPALCLEGLTIVISPLIALMKDQVERLHTLNIPATYIAGSISRHQVDYHLQAAMDGKYKLLYLAPERLTSDMFQLRLHKMNISLCAVDEAHCVSQWGYDFRPSYLQIPQIREQLPDVPLIALTASATQSVKEDMLEKLSMKAARVFQQSFKRTNLKYFVFHEENVFQRVIAISQRLQGSGIIYVRTRRRTLSTSKELQKYGLSVAPYHGGLPASERTTTQQQWIEGKIRIIVATNAFGMGIDKADVRFVIHMNLPFDMESYYQEAGRGGRDRQTALAIAFNNPTDIQELKKWNSQKYPSWEVLANHYDILCKHYQLGDEYFPEEPLIFDLAQFVESYHLNLIRFYNSLKILDQEGIIDLQEENDDYGYVKISCSPQDILTYKQNHPLYRDLLNHILRTCGGEVYTREVRFLPYNWASNLGMTESILTDRLDRLVQHGLIAYTPPSRQPTVQFLQPRKYFSKNALDWNKYTFLKAQTAFRLTKLIQYVESTSQCRSLLIQHYFGEEDKIPCGKCDVCVGRYKQSIKAKDFKAVQEAIISFIQSHPGITYRELILNLPLMNPTKKEKVLRYLIDKQVVISDSLGVLSTRTSS